jgi:hypothetical protein
MHTLHFTLFFLTSTGLANHLGWCISLMNLDAWSMPISSPMALHFLHQRNAVDALHVWSQA